MSYRVETASSGRAKCIATECKDNGVKIDKDDLRLGVWVEYQDRGGWTWKHWGCVTGFQLQNIRKMLADPTKPDGYNWDFLDGYEGDEKNSLDKRPQLQEKVRRVIMQGYIDPEDWNGDPEMNKLGEKGLRSQETKQRMAAEKRQGKKEIAELNAHIAAMQEEMAVLRSSGASTAKLDSEIAKLEEEVESKSPGKKKAVAPKKRPRANEDSDDEQAAETATPVKKKRATKAKKEESDDEQDVKPKSTKKSRVKKEVKLEDQNMNVDEVKPPKKSRAKKAVKQEDSDDEDEMEDVVEDVKPTKRSRAKKAVKQEDSEDEDEVMPAPSRRAAGKRGVKKEEAVKNEPESDAPAVTAPKKAARGRKAVKNEEDDEASAAVEEKPAVKKGRKKMAKKEEADVDNVKPSGSDIYHGSPVSSPTKNDPEPPVRIKGEPSNANSGIDSKNGIDIKRSKSELKSSDTIKGDPSNHANGVPTNPKDEATKEEADIPKYKLPNSIRNFDFGHIPISFNTGHEFADILDEFGNAYLADAIDGFTAARDGTTDDGHAAWLKYLEMKGYTEPKAPEAKKAGRGKKASAPAPTSSSSRASRSRTSSNK